MVRAPGRRRTEINRWTTPCGRWQGLWLGVELPPHIRTRQIALKGRAEYATEPKGRLTFALGRLLSKDGLNMPPGQRPASHLHHFLLFTPRELFHPLDLFIGQLLNLIQRALLLVLGDPLLLRRLLARLVADAACISDASPMLLEKAIHALPHIPQP